MSSKGYLRKQKKKHSDSQLIRNQDEIAKGTVGGWRLRDSIDTHRFMLVETVDEAGFYDHAAQRHAHQQKQQGLRCPNTLSPLFQPGWHLRPGGLAVHHIHRGTSSLRHAYSALSVTEKMTERRNNPQKLSEGVASEELQTQTET